MKLTIEIDLDHQDVKPENGDAHPNFKLYQVLHRFAHEMLEFEYAARYLSADHVVYPLSKDDDGNGAGCFTVRSDVRDWPCRECGDLNLEWDDANGGKATRNVYCKSCGEQFNLDTGYPEPEEWEDPFPMNPEEW